MDRKLLAIYLNDHLAVTTAGVELARRMAGQNRGDPLEPLAERLAGDLAEEREQVLVLFERLGVGRDRVKEAGGWLGEKLGRLKLNGRITDYSPLSRVTELEAMLAIQQLGVSFWRSLRVGLGEDERLRGLDFDRLAERAAANRRAVEKRVADALSRAIA